jgi:hypothetical protein
MDIVNEVCDTKVEFNDKLDMDGEMEMTLSDVEYRYKSAAYTYITRSNALDIVHHLAIMFEINLTEEI